MKTPRLIIKAAAIAVLVTPAGAMAGDAENGATVFDSTCVACHAEDGKGAFPGIPDFTKAGGRLAQSDEQLFQSIKFGMQTPGSIMPMPELGGNPDITDQQVRDVIAYLKATFQDH
jgi:mono/diheme cytochrome c family protein